MWRPIRNLTLLLLVALAAAPVAAQTSADDLAARTTETLYRLAHLFEPPAQSITIPNTFVNGTVADATQVNANFTALSSNALNRNGGTMLGTLNSRAITPTSDATYDLGTLVLRIRHVWTSGTTRFGGVTWTWPAADGTSGQVFTTNGSGTLQIGNLGVAGGGTGLASGTSGGVLYFSAAATIASSAALAANALVLGGGAGVAPATDSNWTINAQHVLSSATQFRAIAFHSTTQSLSTATLTILNLDSEDVDVGTLHDLVTNNSRVIVPTGGAGFWCMYGHVNFANNTTGLREVYLRKNGTTDLETVIATPIASGGAALDVPITRCAVLADADYIELRARQDSGGNLNAGSATRANANALTLVKFF